MCVITFVTAIPSEPMAGAKGSWLHHAKALTKPRGDWPSILVFGKKPRDPFHRAHAMNSADVNLYLVGFMGTGKSTIGRFVGQRLGFTVLDSDQEIERQQGKTIADIFAQDGEPAFRAMERAFIEKGHAATRTVISCGGGLVVQPNMLAELKSRGVVICLHASVETILARTARHRNRPLLEVANPEERIRTLYAQREPIYKMAGTLILTDARPLHEITAHVIRAWRREAADFACFAGRVSPPRAPAEVAKP